MCVCVYTHILRTNCLLQPVIEGNKKGGIEVTGRRGRRRKKLLDDLKEWIGYYHLKEEALDLTELRATKVLNNNNNNNNNV
jgi:hypothetical protein